MMNRCLKKFSVDWLLRAAWGTSLVLATIAFTGCGGPVEGTVSGTVTYNGAPLADASVNFHSSKTGIASSATLDKSGAFTLPGSLPVGDYKVFVQPPPPQQLPPGTPQPEQTIMQIPPKYQDPGQTPLSQTVAAGENSFSIEIVN